MIHFMTASSPSASRAASKRYHHGDLGPALLKAAEEELAENGTESFSLRAVAKRAGVSHGAPAHHFGDAKGLLTALAAIGYDRLIAVQEARQATAAPDKTSQLIAIGLGYVDFGIANPALFRLMFSSEKPDRSDEAFAASSLAAFGKLVELVQAEVGADPYSDAAAMKDVVASWAMVHGLADLILSGRIERLMGLSQLPQDETDAILTDILLRPIPR
ncbi:hypothetical protein HY3_16415 [Hyphomonas pacifica]|uniref:Uncharacterized protein n=2 Tax=Hyphomonas pacifica TaxID=1280941 RepID=A0A062TZ96_9PROT|nr:hypothetical protein HY2_16105 [Hyphomonas pacifica]RAN31584.1 hypothetical protein HY3_16415 [Hyphomonas pacifica]